MRFLTLDNKWKECPLKKIDWDAPSLSKFQFRVKTFLRPYWESSLFVAEEFLIPNGRLSIDLINFDRRIAIECDGIQHDRYCPWFHASREDFIKQIDRDQIKEKCCEKNKIRLIRVYEDTILTKENFESIFGAGVL